MDDRKRMLATAWRDLAGWKLWMVLGVGPGRWQGHAVVNKVMLRELAKGDGPLVHGTAECWLPDPDAPANWGVWLAWAWTEFKCGAMPIPPVDASLPVRLLKAVVEWRNEWAEPRLPPSVTAWWEAEQQGGER